ncbi:MAG TPA: hypothetical protein VE990_01045 [Acidimicrobiales bacterium]|nr:hypothetical protein [Acidimicrobiales bacterium]
MSSGRMLYRLVEEYSALGEHRTGTDVDRATVDWFSAQLEALGAEVERHPYEFDRYACDWEVTADGDPVESLPLFYEGVGDIDTDAPAVTASRVIAGTVVPDFEALSDVLRDEAEVALIATKVAGGFLCAPNRQVHEPVGMPAICVAGREIDRLQQASLRVRLAARIEKGRSANVRGTLGEGPPSSAVLLTTPLSGWFRCAGERGTGIAVCLAVAKALAESHRVTVLGCNSHELMGLGAHHYLATTPPDEAAIFHFGASVASGDADGINPPSRRSRQVRATAWAGGSHREALGEALSPLGVEVRLPDDEAARRADSWLGEASVWAPLGRPLVSIAGGFPLHHVPLDLPPLATNEQLLEESFAAASAAARVLGAVAAEGPPK